MPNIQNMDFSDIYYSGVINITHFLRPNLLVLSRNSNFLMELVEHHYYSSKTYDL